MRVKDLIEELEECDEESEVKVYHKTAEQEFEIYEVHRDIDGKVFIDIFFD